MKKIGCLSFVGIFVLAGGFFLWGITIAKENKSLQKRIEQSWEEVALALDSVQVSLEHLKKQDKKEWEKRKTFAQEFERIKQNDPHSDQLTYSASLFSFLERNKKFWKQDTMTSRGGINHPSFLHDLEKKIRALEKKTHAHLIHSEEHEQFLNAFPHREFIEILKFVGLFQ